jgi:hypothetical protein
MSERDGLGIGSLRRPDTMWKVARVEDGAELGRYASKPKALAAALRFSADGCAYEIIEAPADTVREARGIVVPMRDR